MNVATPTPIHTPQPPPSPHTHTHKRISILMFGVFGKSLVLKKKITTLAHPSMRASLSQVAISSSTIHIFKYRRANSGSRWRLNEK